MKRKYIKIFGIFKSVWNNTAVTSKLCSGKIEDMSSNEVNCNNMEMRQPSESVQQYDLDGPERVTKPRDKRLDRLKKKRWQFSSRSQSSQWSEGSFDATESGKEPKHLLHFFHWLIQFWYQFWYDHTYLH